VGNVTALIPDLTGYAAGAIGVIAAIVAAWWAGRRGGKRAVENDALRQQISTGKAIDDALEGVGDDPGLGRRWLSERGKRGGNL
jgi:hypothetical protein